MIENLEIETKVMIDQSCYERLVNQLKLSSPVDQTNYYYKAQSCAENLSLRIRQLSTDSYLFTCKQKVGQYHKEYEQTLSENNINSVLLQPIYDLLNIKGPFTLISQSRTIRYTLKLQHGEIMLDHSFFRWGEDYEIEFEAKDLTDTCKKEFVEWLNKNNINYTPSKYSKFKRAMLNNN